MGQKVRFLLYNTYDDADLDLQTDAFYLYLPGGHMGMVYTSGLARPSRTWMRF